MISFTTFYRENYNIVTWTPILRMCHSSEPIPIWPHDVNDWILDREIDDSLASFAEDDSGEIAACNQGERTRRETRECYLSKRVIILSMMSCGILFCHMYLATGNQR